MIIELCGMPAAGKTTVARLLETYLRERGHDVALVQSSRPQEVDKELGGVAALSQRLIRPGMATLAATGSPPIRKQHSQLVGELMRLLPPRSLLWSVRLRWYLRRLAYNRDCASRASGVTIFDQGFIQALASLTVLASSAGTQDIAAAFRCIPSPDLLIRVNARTDLMEARLRARLQGQGGFERRLELDPKTNMRFQPALDGLCAAFSEQVAPVVQIVSDGPISPLTAFASIERTMAGAQGFRPRAGRHWNSARVSSA